MTSIIKNPNAVETYTVNFQNIGNITVYKYKGLATIQFEKTVQYALSGGTRVMSLPTELVPREGFRALAVDTSGTVIPLQFNNGSSVYVTKSISANTAIAICVTYETA